MQLALVDDVRRAGRVFHSPGLSFAGRVVEGWEALLGRYEWDWFATFTFESEKHPEAADKVFRVWMSKLQRSVAGNSWKKKPADTVRWARGLEWQRRGVLHFHALLYHRLGLNQLQQRFAWMAEWQALTGSFAKILPCDSSGAVRGYIAKYCGKGGLVDCSRDLPTVEVGRELQRC
jgi:hypothetical protein